jgi:glycosyltransferase involved in cell wall biosynthesis
MDYDHVKPESCDDDRLQADAPVRICMISRFLPRMDGVATYVSYLIHHLGRRVDVTVFADRTSGMNCLQGDNYRVVRCWQEFLYPFQVFLALLRESARLVHVQHEVYLYGPLFSAALFPLLLLFAKLLGRRVITTLHNGIVQKEDLYGDFFDNIQVKGVRTLLRHGLIVSKRLAVFLSDAVVVHEERFKHILEEEYRCQKGKIVVIPHGVWQQTDRILDQGSAKSILNLDDRKVILFFGYLSPYKGVEILLDAYARLRGSHTDMELIIGGGEHPRLKHRPSYSHYVRTLRERCDGVTFTGFIPEEQLSVYLSAADVVVFPYRSHFASSGCLAIAASYRRPVLLSESFGPQDTKSRIFFQHEAEDLASKLEQFFTDDSLRIEAKDYATTLRNEHSWQYVARRTLDLYCKVLAQ